MLIPPRRNLGPQRRPHEVRQKIVFGDSQADLVIGQGAALFWRFDEASGSTALDLAPRHLNGTYAGTYNLQQPGGLSGANFSVRVRTDARVTSGYSLTARAGGVTTFCGWVYLLNLTAAQQFWGGDNAATVGLRVGTNGDVIFSDSVNNNTWAGAFTGLVGQWNHVALIFDDPNDTAELYLNGVSQGVKSTTGTFGATAGNFMAFARTSSFSLPMNGYGNDYAIFERALTPTEINAQYKTFIGTDGGQAPAALSLQAPDTTGYTTKTLTADDHGEINGGRNITLVNATNYVIVAPRVIPHFLQLRGGNNIVIKGMHIRRNYQGRFLPGTIANGLQLIDNGNTGSRRIHIEGLWIEGEDLMEGLDFNAPTADITIGWLRIGSPDKPIRVRSSDLYGILPGGAGGSFGFQPYSGVPVQHPDGMQANVGGGFKTLTIERATIYTAHSGFNMDGATQSGALTLRKVEFIAVPSTRVEEGPYVFSSTFVQSGATLETWDAGVGSWVADTGSTPATLTSNSTTPITGAASLKLERNGAYRAMGATLPFATPQDLSLNGTAIRLKARLDGGGGGFPMIRVDVTTISTATTDPNATPVDWHLGDATKLVNGSTVDVVSNFPPAILAAVRKIRIVVMKDGTNDDMIVTVDELAFGTGDAAITYSGGLAYSGDWAIHRQSGCCPLYLTDVYARNRAEGYYVGGVVYAGRYWDGAAYQNDLPPGNAVFNDFFAGSGVARTNSSDGQGEYVKFTDSGIHGATVVDAGYIRNGVPPASVGAVNGEFCPEGIAGINYVSSSDLAPVGGESGTLTEASSVAVATATSESGTFTESSSIAVTLATTDAATGSEAAAVAATLPGTDSATLTEATSTGLPSSDSGALTEATSTALATSDTGSLTEASSAAIAVAGSESASLSESTTTGLPGVESGSLVEASAVAASVAGAESGALSEATVTTLPGSDNAALSEASALAAALVSTDSAASTEATTTTLPTSDAGSGTDSSALAAAEGASDSGTLSESSATGLPSTDSGALADASAVAVALAASDDASLAETTAAQAQLAAADSAAGTDTALVESGTQIAGADAGTLSETASAAPGIIGAEAAGLAEATGVSASETASDSANLSESAGVAAASQLGATDSASFSESAVLVVILAPVDDGTASELAAFAAALSGAESAAVTDVAGLLSALSDTESATEAEASELGFTVATIGPVRVDQSDSPAILVGLSDVAH